MGEAGLLVPRSDDFGEAKLLSADRFQKTNWQIPEQTINKKNRNADQAMTLSEARLLVPRSDDYGEANNKQSQTKE